ncbi:hypothetical protein SH668x_003285 [Planctomicrobium sp. SH668]|uniref:hypothetical protein n=1 Tax=Planctomicrobium sp. SH668 TaxID=3448126 RepID=UPI003F5C5788
MDSSAAWQQLFDRWPDSQPRVGVIVTTSQESIGFTDFMVSPGILALERDRPDTLGARKVLIAFSAITAVKFMDTQDFDKIAVLGFC